MKNAVENFASMVDGLSSYDDTVTINVPAFILSDLIKFREKFPVSVQWALLLLRLDKVDLRGQNSYTVGTLRQTLDAMIKAGLVK